MVGFTNYFICRRRIINWNKNETSDQTQNKEENKREGS